LAVFGVDIAKSFQVDEFPLALLQVACSHVAGSNKPDFYRSAFQRTARYGRSAQCYKRRGSRKRLQKIPSSSILHLIGQLHFHLPASALAVISTLHRLGLVPEDSWLLGARVPA
jgi:hypothetical protein